MTGGPLLHSACANYLRDRLAALGVDADVSPRPTAPDSAYATAPFVCPHGVAFYPLPTDAQVAAWEAEETRHD